MSVISRRVVLLKCCLACPHKLCVLILNVHVQVMQLLSSPYDRCNSSLLCDENTALTTFILSLVGLKVGHVMICM